MKTGVIANPRSAGGRTGKRWERLRRALESRLGDVEIRFTERAGHATQLARDLLLCGCDRIIGVGGDGTFNEIANGFMDHDQPIRPGACLGIVPTGTGGDLQRSLELPSNPAQAIEVLSETVPMEIDLGKITFRAYDGQTRTRYFVNLSSFGMGGEVSAQAKNFLGVFGGKAAFLWATFKVILAYRGKKVELTLDDWSRPRRYSVLNVAVGNGPFHGGGMYVCPRARFNDGLLEVTIIDDLGLLTLLKDVRYLYNGNIYEHPKCHHFRAKKIVAASPVETRIEVDGEPLGTLPVEISVLPRCLRVLVPEGSPLFG